MQVKSGGLPRNRNAIGNDMPCFSWLGEQTKQYCGEA